MSDWYRRKTWTKTDEEEFNAKLSRARKDGRAQYLRLQAYELVETKDESLFYPAEILLNKILTEYPENNFEKSSTYNQLGEIYKLRNDYDKAIEYFEKSLDFEKEYSKVITTSYLEFAETVIRAEKIELYDKVYELLTAKINETSLKFPNQNYIIYSVMAIISNYRDDFENAKNYVELADKYASAETNSLWNPRKNKIGVVKERINLLDKLVGKK
jgi:tetratricopeptide (TPR) repeat protein